jgi:tetratricopeptide (TPR) repeat protein
MKRSKIFFGAQLIINICTLTAISYIHAYKESDLALKKLLKTEKDYLRALEEEPHSSELHYHYGIFLSNHGYKNAAIAQFQETLFYNPAHINAALQKAHLLHKQKSNKKAQKTLKGSLFYNPKSAELHYLLGLLYKEEEHFPDALIHLKKAYTIKPLDMRYVMQYANTLNIAGQNLETCIKLYKNVLEHYPTYKAARYNYAYTLKRLELYEQALALFNEIIEQDPTYALARFSRALTLLTLGNFKQGWEEYEWRWKAYKETPKTFFQPPWNGSDPYKKRLLLYSEQGLGDTLQFIRYAKELKKQGAHIIACVQKPLQKILSLCPYIDTVITSDETIPHFDMHAPLMSLPFLCETTQKTIPQNIPYLFADITLTKTWKTRLKKNKNFKIGICWQGNAHYRTQALRQVVKQKSAPLKLFEPFANIKGVTLFSLQKTSGIEQIDSCSKDFSLQTFNDFDESNGRFMDTAAIIQSLDLIITIDTSMAHLAGGLGCPVWVMLPKPADWRWMLNKQTTPWYPNMHLFRQSTVGDWKTVIKNMVEKLSTILNNSGEQL